jgi:hypothetical protein
MENELAKKEDSELAVSGAFEQDADQGFEEASKDDYALPFLKLLQKMSPEVDEDDGAYIEGAKAGMFMDSVSNVLYAQPVVIPVHFTKSVLMFIPRVDGGGFQGEISMQEAEKILGVNSMRDAQRNDKGHIMHPDENWQMVETSTHYVLYEAAPGSWVPSVIGLSSTQLKHSRKWMTAMQQLKFDRADGTGKFTPPMWASMYQLGSTQESNDKGTWSGLTFARQGTPEDANVIAQAKAFREAIVSGKAEVKHEEADGSAESGVDANGEPVDENGDPIPF